MKRTTLLAGLMLGVCIISLGILLTNHYKKDIDFFNALSESERTRLTTLRHEVVYQRDLIVWNDGTVSVVIMGHGPLNRVRISDSIISNPHQLFLDWNSDLAKIQEIIRSQDPKHAEYMAKFAKQ